jgi:hypothetical protein
MNVRIWNIWSLMCSSDHYKARLSSFYEIPYSYSLILLLAG